MALEKAKIIVYGQNDRKKDEVKVHFNPNQFSEDKANQIAEIGVPGLSAPILQFVRGNTRTLSMELLFDTYEDNKDVRKEYTDKVYQLLEIDPDTHAPPICEFVWKDFTFKCVVDRVSGRFTLFRENGIPVRATLNVTFKHYIPVAKIVRANPTRSADHTKTYTVKLGDTLSSIAAAEYGDPTKWRPIAAANRIDNPRVLTPGRVLEIPPLL